MDLADWCSRFCSYLQNKKMAWSSKQLGASKAVHNNQMTRKGFTKS